MPASVRTCARMASCGASSSMWSYRPSLLRGDTGAMTEAAVIKGEHAQAPGPQLFAMAHLHCGECRLGVAVHMQYPVAGVVQGSAAKTSAASELPP